MMSGVERLVPVFRAISGTFTRMLVLLSSSSFELTAVEILVRGH
jgi:hypothetical protein